MTRLYLKLKPNMVANIEPTRKKSVISKNIAKGFFVFRGIGEANGRKRHFAKRRSPSAQTFKFIWVTLLCFLGWLPSSVHPQSSFQTELLKGLADGSQRGGEWTVNLNNCVLEVLHVSDKSCQNTMKRPFVLSTLDLKEVSSVDSQSFGGKTVIYFSFNAAVEKALDEARGIREFRDRTKDLLSTDLVHGEEQLIAAGVRSKRTYRSCHVERGLEIRSDLRDRLLVGGQNAPKLVNSITELVLSCHGKYSN